MLITFLIDDDPDDQDDSFTPQLIFIDINMPRVDGIECLRNLRQIRRLQHVPAFMYSTAADNRVVEHCLKLGANGFLQKQGSIADAKKDFEEILANLKLLGR